MSARTPGRRRARSSDGQSLFAELKRRNVLRASAAYVALGWVVTQVTATVAPMLNLPQWTGPLVLWIGIIGFPFLVMFAWIYELTPEGLKRESEIDRDASITHVTAKRLDYAVIGLLVVAIGLFVFDRVRPREAATPAPATAAQTTQAPAAPAEPAVSDASIAVLPFNNMSSDKEQEYFSDGISEELLNLLAKIPSLQVAARTSSFSFKGKDVEIPEIARQLRVAHVLEGSVRKSGSRIRITAQLIRADNGYHLWSETYDREFTDVFKLQDEIAGAVVSALKLKLLPEQLRAGANPTANPEAYNQYLLGNQYYNRGNRDGYRRAAEAYAQAIALDPDFAEAHVGLAFAEGFGSDWAGSAAAADAARARALAAGERAIALAPNLAEAHAARAWLRYTFRRDWVGAKPDFDRAMALGSGRADVQRAYANYLVGIGDLPNAIAAMRRSTELDPLAARSWSGLGRFYGFAGHLVESEQALSRALAISPESSLILYSLGITYILQGRAPEALPVFARAGDVYRQAGTAMAEHALGRARESDAALEELVARFGDNGAYQIAQVYARRGQKDQAFEWLERAYAQGDPGLIATKADALLASLRGDPRYVALLKKLGLPG